MVCIYCGSETKVTNSRHKKKTNETWRRRECLNCQAVFTTLELTDLGGSLSVKDKKGHLEPFERDKLWLSIMSACGHRKDASQAASSLTATVISQLLPQINQATLSKEEIVETVAQVLKRFDKAANVSYLAYHSR